MEYASKFYVDGGIVFFGMARSLRLLVEEIVRVDHAGERAAVAIYKGQLKILPGLVGGQEMLRHEEEHLRYFEDLVVKKGVRPTVFLGFWDILGFGLGAGVAFLGESSALACTQAVEEVIEEHYARQIKILEKTKTEGALKKTLERFREEEQAHKTYAKDSGALDAPGHSLLTAVIRTGCRVAIALSEKL